MSNTLDELSIPSPLEEEAGPKLYRLRHACMHVYLGGWDSDDDYGPTL